MTMNKNVRHALKQHSVICSTCKYRLLLLYVRVVWNSKLCHTHTIRCI